MLEQDFVIHLVLLGLSFKKFILNCGCMFIASHDWKAHIQQRENLILMLPSRHV